MKNSSSEYASQLSTIQAEIGALESEISALENEVDQKLRSDVRGEKAYTQSARNADQQALSNKRYRLDELRKTRPHVEELRLEATANERALEADRISVEMGEVEEEASELLDRLEGFFAEYLTVDQEILAAFQRWGSLEKRRIALTGRRSTERGFPCCENRFQGLEPLGPRPIRRREYLRRMPGWIRAWRPGSKS